jgi:hypothetical protein
MAPTAGEWSRASSRASRSTVARPVSAATSCSAAKGSPASRFPSVLSVDEVDDDAAHRARGQRDEVGTVDDRRGRPPREPDVRFVDECGWAQGLAGPQPRELAPRQPAQLVIDQAEDFVDRSRLAPPPGGQDRLEVFSRHVVLYSAAGASPGIVGGIAARRLATLRVAEPFGFRALAAWSKGRKRRPCARWAWTRSPGARASASRWSQAWSWASP